MTSLHISPTAALALSLAMIPATLRGQDSPAVIIQRAATAMGGAAALRGLNNATLEYHSATFGLGQEETPMSPARATFAIARSVTDYRANRRLLTQESRAVTGAMSSLRRVITPTIGVTQNNNAVNVDPPGAVVNALAEIRARPERMILFALDNPSQVSGVEPPKRIRGELMDGVRIGTGSDAPIYWFDRISRL